MKGNRIFFYLIHNMMGLIQPVAMTTVHKENFRSLASCVYSHTRYNTGNACKIGYIFARNCSYLRVAWVFPKRARGF